MSTTSDVLDSIFERLANKYVASSMVELLLVQKLIDQQE